MSRCKKLRVPKFAVFFSIALDSLTRQENASAVMKSCNAYYVNYINHHRRKLAALSTLRQRHHCFFFHEKMTYALQWPCLGVSATSLSFENGGLP